MLGLNEVQSGVIDVMYKIADENGLKLIDFKDLKIMLKYMADFSSDISNKYGNVAKQSINAIQRTLIRFENEGAIDFFGEPSFDVDDLLIKNGEKGTANILNCTKLYLNSKMYQSVVIYLLSQIFTSLDEVGDLDKPRLVLFLDEAHLIFKDLNKKMLENIVTIIKLIRSKGVGIFFVTQNPKDIPEEVLSQLSNRIEHALRAYTPNEIKNVKFAADSFRKNPNFDSEKAILNLKTGEALVSTLNEDGEPSMAEITLIRPPMSKIGMIDSAVFNDIVNNSDFNKKYKEPIDRESAYEILSERYIQINKEMEAEKAEKEAQKEYRTKQNQKKRNEGMADKVIKRVFSAFTYQIGKTVARDIMNTLKKKL